MPRAHERPVMGMKSNKDFIKTNAVQAITATPRAFEATALDGTAGAGGRFKLEDSGLVPKYSKKEDYGKVPDYLHSFKEVRPSARCPHTPPRPIPGPIWRELPPAG